MTDEMYQPESPIKELTSEDVLVLLKDYDLAYRINIAEGQSTNKGTHFNQGKAQQLKDLLTKLNQLNSLDQIEKLAQKDNQEGTLTIKADEPKFEGDSGIRYKTNTNIQPESYPNLGKTDIRVLLTEFGSKLQSLETSKKEFDNEFTQSIQGKLKILEDILKTLGQANALEKIRALIYKQQSSKSNTGDSIDTSENEYYSSLIIAADFLIGQAANKESVADFHFIIVLLSNLERLLDHGRVFVRSTQERDQLNRELDRIRAEIHKLSERADRDEFSRVIEAYCTDLQHRFVPEQ